MNETVHILLVEDDVNFGDVLANYLRIHDYEVTLARDGEEGWHAFLDGEFDICVLDVMMPKKDGFTLAKEIRQTHSKLPIIFLTAKSMKADILEGFESGADDYMTKPIHTEELMMRIQAVLRRTHTRKAKRFFEIGKFYFDSQLRLLTFDEDEQQVEKLSPKESALLHLFCQHLNEVVERSVALRKIWKKDDYFTARSMDVFVTKLRKYLKKDPRVEIVNIHGNGFQLMVRESK